MAGILTQDHIATAMPDLGPDYIRRKSKQDLQSRQFPEAKLSRYKGPAKPPMPKSDSKFQVLPLKVLANAQVSLNRAKDIDFHFMQLIANTVEVPEYNGYNTKIAREAGQKLQPRTYVTYFPLININPAEPGTILTTIHMVKTATENYSQTYTICTNDQQLFKITAQMTWWQPNVWENFYPISGGVHLLMSFVGCIGNLMENTGLPNIPKAIFGGVDKMLLGKTFSITSELCAWSSRKS